MSNKLLRKISLLFSNHNFNDLDISAIENMIRYKFRNLDLLYTALKHSSFLPITKEKPYRSNERLEFLGDAVLDLVVTEFLYLNFPKTLEGELSKMKSVLVSRNVLAEVVSNLELGKHLLINRGEEKTGGRTRPSNLANLYEAILGAIYLDGGLKPARTFVEKTLLKSYEGLLNHKSFINYKSILLEYVQGQGPGNAIYHVIEESGPDHEKKFVMDVSIGGKERAQGWGKSKKLAEQAAAYNLLKKIAPDLLPAAR